MPAATTPLPIIRPAAKRKVVDRILGFCQGTIVGDPPVRRAAVPCASPSMMLALRHAQGRLGCIARDARIASRSHVAVRGLFTSETKEPSSPLQRLSASIHEAQDRAHALQSELAPYYEEASKRYRSFRASPYGRLMRLDQPTGTHLLFLPCAWGIALSAATPLDAAGVSLLCYGGAVLARGAGCTVNDIFDADVDASVARTRARPLAAGEASTASAAALASLQFAGALAVLTSLSPTSFILGTATLIPIVYYPLAKRLVAHPQMVLAGTFNAGALIGYAACADAVAGPAVMLYGSGVCWTMVYDTVYGHQDKKDDARLGIRSSALSFGGDSRRALAAFGVGQFACLFAAGWLADLGTTFYMGSAVAASRVFSQIFDTDLDDPKACGGAFKDSAKNGALIWASILAGRLV